MTMPAQQPEHAHEWYCATCGAQATEREADIIGRDEMQRKRTAAAQEISDARWRKMLEDNHMDVPDFLKDDKDKKRGGDKT